MLTSTRLDLEEATVLAHGLVAQIAREAGIRVFAVKGPVAERYRLRERRVSADADIWVEPARFSDLCRLLEDRGWHSRVAREMPSLLPPHARTYIHDEWPCDIDLHSSFTGFFAEPEVTFDAIWQRTVIVCVAHTPIRFPSRPAAAVIGLLHALRSAWLAGRANEEARIVEAVTMEFSSQERAEFYDLALKGQAVWALRDIVASARLGPVIIDVDDEQRRRWTRHRAFAADGSTAGWWEHARESPWWARPMIIARAAWVPRAQIPRNDVDALPTPAEAWTYQADRWRRGLRGTAHLIAHRFRRRAGWRSRRASCETSDDSI